MADPRLRHQAENHIGTNEIDIAAMKPRYLDAMSYVCFGVAKDIITGSRTASVTELADASMLSPRYFLVIQTTMLIRGYGLSAAKSGSFFTPPSRKARPPSYSIRALSCSCRNRALSTATGRVCL